MTIHVANLGSHIYHPSAWLNLMASLKYRQYLAYNSLIMNIWLPQKGFIVDVRLRALIDPKLVPETGFGFIPVNPFQCEHTIDLNIPHYNGWTANQDIRFYEFVNGGTPKFTPCLFSDRYSNNILPIYTKIANTNFNSDEDFYTFPFRDNIVPSMVVGGFQANVVKEHERVKAKIIEISKEISKGNKPDTNLIVSEIKSSEQVAYLNEYYLDNSFFNFDLGKSWKTNDEKWADPKYQQWCKIPTRITVFEGWYSYAFWELYQKLTTDMSISACRKCGNLIDIKPGGHKDRFYCSKEENIICWQERLRERKAKERRKIG